MIGIDPANRTDNKVNIVMFQKALKQWEMSWRGGFEGTGLYLKISSCIKSLTELDNLEPYLIRDWVWITAQYRITHESNEEVARTCWAAINLFETIVQKMMNESMNILEELCWLTDMTVETLLGILGPQAINRFISSEEQQKIDDLIISLAESDNYNLDELIFFATEVVAEFSTIHHSNYFPSIADKLSKLCEVSYESSEASYWAKAVLQYIKLKKDVIDDDLGYVGFSDDIHVIENMYGFVFGELPWKRLIDHASKQWPFITRVYWQDQNTKRHLPPLLKAVISCCLDSSLEQKQSRTIVLQDIGPCGFLSAVSCVLYGIESEKMRSIPEPGVIATFRDGHIPRYVKMEPPVTHSDGTVHLMAKLKDLSISIEPSYAVLLEPGNNEKVKLATLSQFQHWLSNVKKDKQTAIHQFHNADIKSPVLYITNRADFFNYLKTIQPFGRRLDELIAVEYISRWHKSSHGSGALAIDPALIVCYSLDVAERIIREKVSSRPKYMIIDRIVDRITLAALLERSSQNNPGMKVVVFSQLDPRIRTYRSNQKESIWFIQPEDIDPISMQKKPVSFSGIGKGPISMYVQRQNRASNVKQSTRHVEFAELDAFYQITNKIKKKALKDDSSLLPFAINAETALRYISRYPPVGHSIADERLDLVLTNLSQHATVMGMYNQDIRNLASASTELLKAIKEKNPKARILAELVKAYKKCHIVVASRTIADSHSNTVFNFDNFDPRFISVHDLESLMSTELLIIPGWLGHKEMLHLRLGGWPGDQLHILYDFEYEYSAKQSRKLEKTKIHLSHKTIDSWKTFLIRNPEVGSPPAISRNNQSIESDSIINESENVSSESDDWLEFAVCEHISSTFTSQSIQAQILGRLMFFNDGQRYGIFAENANLVCLNEILGRSLNAAELSESEAEKLLWKSAKHLETGDVLAFPDDPALGDIIDELADAILDDDGATRTQASLWRNALQKIYEASNRDLDKMQDELLHHNVDRTCVTLRSWLFTTKTVAPKNPSKTIPKILECAGIEDAEELANKIIKHVSTIYATRRKAGHHLVAQLSTASISSLGNRAFIEINGKKISYRVLSISSIHETVRFNASVQGVHLVHDGLPGVE